MPTYDYRCNDCGHEFEIFQNMTDDLLKDCPVCKGRVERLIGAGAGFIFKGSGFYITDNRSDSYRKAAKADKPSDTTTNAKTDTTKVKTDTTKAVPAKK